MQAPYAAPWACGCMLRLEMVFFVSDKEFWTYLLEIITHAATISAMGLWIHAVARDDLLYLYCVGSLSMSRA